MSATVEYLEEADPVLHMQLESALKEVSAVGIGVGTKRASRRGASARLKRRRVEPTEIE